MEKKAELLKSLRHPITAAHAASVRSQERDSRGTKCAIFQKRLNTHREPEWAGSQAGKRSKPTSPWLGAQSLTEESLQIFSHKTGAVPQLGE